MLIIIFWWVSSQHRYKHVLSLGNATLLRMTCSQYSKGLKSQILTCFWTSSFFVFKDVIKLFLGISKREEEARKYEFLYCILLNRLKCFHDRLSDDQVVFHRDSLIFETFAWQFNFPSFDINNIPSSLSRLLNFKYRKHCGHLMGNHAILRVIEGNVQIHSSLSV